MMKRVSDALAKICAVAIVVTMVALSVLIAAAMACGCVGIIRWGLGF